MNTIILILPRVFLYFSEGLWVFSKEPFWFHHRLLERIDDSSLCASLNSSVVKVPGKPHSLLSLGVKFLLLMVGQVKYVHALTSWHAHVGLSVCSISRNRSMTFLWYLWWNTPGRSWRASEQLAQFLYLLFSLPFIFFTCFPRKVLRSRQCFCLDKLGVNCFVLQVPA